MLDQLHVALDTSGHKNIKPQNPARVFTVADQDDLMLFDQKFEVEQKKKIIIKKHEGPKCISCGQCTRVCHQGIDVMSFANKGVPMADPECVRCSACVQVCPTGVLRFGRVNGRGALIGIDSLGASPVQMREGA